MNDPYAHLNPAQRKAVFTTKGRVLILAGAGSGKTSVLTHRVAHLVRHCSVPAQSILGLTFTNKAAAEMRSRLAKMIPGKEARQVTLCTFHSFCMGILRNEIGRLGYTKNFSLYNEKDIKRLVSQLTRHMLEHEGELPSLEPTLALIAKAKNKGASPEDKNEIWHDQFSKELYQRLQVCMRAYNAVDFDSLLSLTIELFEQFPEVLATYQERYLNIMIDEYQDTNPIQYRLAALLSQKHRNLCVVGDDDQSIYGWRGAEIKHILQFEADEVIKLEQNYRSTPLILGAANAVIANNKERHQKHLWSDAASGDPITLFHAPTEQEEANSVVRRIISLHKEKKVPWKEIAILYRSNVLSRAFETALMQALWEKDGKWIRGVPYQIFGGTEFFERSEIRDLVAYLKVISNPMDQEALLRIINVPRRGISDACLDHLTQINRQKQIPLWEILRQIHQGTFANAEPISDKGMRGIESFVKMIEGAQKNFMERPLHEATLGLVNAINYQKAIDEEVKSEKMREFKWENVLNFIEQIKKYEEDPHGEEKKSLVDFLSVTCLDEEKWHAASSHLEDKVNLMTFHSAKGLEFTACFLVCLEDHIIPHEKSLLEGGLEEERRLMYVAITRAKKHLTLSMSRNRKKMGKDIQSSPSRFLFEIPKEHVRITSWQTVD